jgi:hypothetical protein
MNGYRLRDGDLTPKRDDFFLEMLPPPPIGVEIGFEGSAAVFGGADAILLDGETPAKIGNQTFRLVCRRGRLFDFPDGPGHQQILQAPDTGVPFRDLVPKPPLLPLHGVAQTGYLAFLEGQPPDVGPVRGADQVREHMDVAECLRNQCLIGRRVRENGPVGSWDIARVGRGLPKGAQRSGILGGIKPADSCSVPFIQGLVQKPGPHVLAAGQEDGETMKVVVGGIRPSQPDLAKETADLVGGQARSDNRTVQALTEIPDPAPAGRTGNDFGYVAHLALSDQRPLDGF